MAISTNFLLKGYHGHINRQLVVKQYGDKVVLTKFPDMNEIKPSNDQLSQRRSFQDAQRIAIVYLKVYPNLRQIIAPDCQPGQRPYNLLISKLMKGDNQYLESKIDRRMNVRPMGDDWVNTGSKKPRRLLTFRRHLATISPKSAAKFWDSHTH